MTVIEQSFYIILKLILFPSITVLLTMAVSVTVMKICKMNIRSNRNGLLAFCVLTNTIIWIFVLAAVASHNALY